MGVTLELSCSVLPKSGRVVRLGEGRGTGGVMAQPGEGSLQLLSHRRAEQSRARWAWGGLPWDLHPQTPRGIQTLGTKDSAEKRSGRRRQNTPQLLPPARGRLG